MHNSNAIINGKIFFWVATLGETIKTLRDQKGLTQSELGKLVGGKSYQLVQRWEADLGTPTSKTLPTLAEVLGVPLVDLMNLIAKGEPIDVPGNDRPATSVRRASSKSVDVAYLEDDSKAFPVRSDLIKPGVEYAVVTVSDRAMEPQLHKGTILLVRHIEPSEYPYESNGVFAARFGERLTVRRIQANRLRADGELTLHSDNQDYEGITLKSGEIKGLWSVLTILDQPVK